VALLFEGQTVDLDHVVEHAGEHRCHFAVAVPVEARLVGKRVLDKLGEVDGAQQAAAVGRQGLLAAGVGGADVFAKPVVVELVDLVDEDKARFGIVVGGGHDDVPQFARLHAAEHPAGHAALSVLQVAAGIGAVAPHHLAGVVDVDIALARFLLADGEAQGPLFIVVDGVHELVSDQQRQVELAQAGVFALGADKVHHIGVADIKGAHLRAAAATGGGHGKTHLVEDIHKRQRPGGIGTGAGHIGAAGAQGGKFVADTAPGLEGETGLQIALEDALHGIGNGARHGAVDGGGGGFVLQGAGVGDDAPGRDRTVAQGPQKAFVPLILQLGALHLGDGAGHSFVGAIDILVDGITELVFETVLFVPDIFGSGL